MRTNLLWLVLSACTVSDPVPEGVGDPCVPGEVPEGGFQRTEVYVESPSLECRTRACVSNHYRGDLILDPREGDGIEERVEPCGEDCGWAGALDRIYCTAQCVDDAGCPEGFECCPLLAVPEGDYCVRAGTCE